MMLLRNDSLDDGSTGRSTWSRHVALSFCLVVLMTPAPANASDAVVLVADATSPTVQNERADLDDLSRMSDTAMVRRFTAAGYLVGVPSSTSTYYLHDIPAPYRFARPWTLRFIRRLSSQFRARFGHKLRVTSLVRTARYQRRLAIRNPNAAEFEGLSRSSHLTGATIDISKRFMSPAELQWMRRVLFHLREKGYVYAIEEFSQPTFHVMVYRKYAAHGTPRSQRAVSSARVRQKRRQARPAISTKRTTSAQPVIVKRSSPAADSSVGQ